MARRHALVISGGGSKGAFAVGVLKYLFEKETGIEFEIISGTSTGGLIAPLAAIKDIESLERIYTTNSTEDLLLKGDIGDRVLNHNSLFSVKPFIRLARQEFPASAYERLISSGVEIFVSTVCLQTKRLVYFTNSNLQGSDEYDVIQVADHDEMLRAVIASAEQPVFMPPIEIRSSDTEPRQYVDGGVREYAPIQVAIDAGATDILAILLSSGRSGVRNQRYQRIFDILERTVSSYSDEVGANDLAIPQLYSRGTEYVHRLRQKVMAEPGWSPSRVDDIFRVDGSPFSRQRTVRIEVLRLRNNFGLNGLEFDPDRMKLMLQDGYNLAEERFGQAT